MRRLNHKSPSVTASATIAACIAFALFAGCARTMIAEPLATDYAADDVGAELLYWHSLPSRSAVSNDEGLHGLILLAAEEDTTGGYAQRLEYARAHNWVAQGFEEPANLAMQRGTLARAVAVIADIKSGVIMRITGPNARYATRELVALGIIPDGSSENQAITGLEFMSVITRTQDYQALRARGEKPADDLAPTAAREGSQALPTVPASVPDAAAPIPRQGAFPEMTPVPR
ncbi:hypothetical protein BH11PLA1_BH11PLA1_08010 [soil metagenome]